MTMRFEDYAWPGGREWLTAFGPEQGPRVLIVPPLFEEMNYTRTLLAALGRGLAARGIGTWIMDLPGTNESPRALDEVSFADWRAAVAAAAATLTRGGGPPHVASLRGGALLDDAAIARSWWRFAPADGAGLIRQMERAQAIGDKEAGRRTTPGGEHVDLIGYRLTVGLRETLRTAKPAAPSGALRELPLAGPAVAPWRRAEPTRDPALALALVEDLSDWIASCGD